MKIIRGFDSLPPLYGAVVTVGSYDGVHCGHRALLDCVERKAREYGGKSVVMTFEPHPCITLHKAEGLRLLTTLDEKAWLLGRLGIDFLLVVPFDEAFSRLSREEFLGDYIIDRLHARTLVVGYNHRFGRDNEGDYSFLSRTAGIEVIEVQQHLVGAEKVSSTLIRGTLERGDMAAAVRLLGHPYVVMGAADERGTIAVGRYKLLPPEGEYLAKVDGSDSRVYISDGAVRLAEGGASAKNVIVEIYDNARS